MIDEACNELAEMLGIAAADDSAIFPSTNAETGTVLAVAILVTRSRVQLVLLTVHISKSTGVSRMHRVSFIFSPVSAIGGDSI